MVSALLVKIFNTAGSNAAKAASVGANTVNVPAKSLNVPAKSAPITAPSKVVWTVLLITTSATVTFGGKITASNTCTTPFKVGISAITTFALLIITPPFASIETVISWPKSVVAVCPSDKSEDITSDPKTWYNNAFRNLVSTLLVKIFNTAGSNAAKAASVGANTVKLPLRSLNVPAKSAAITAPSKVVWTALLITTSATVTFPGSNTASITCTTPFVASLSGAVTWAVLMNTSIIPLIVTVISWPKTVVAVCPFVSEFEKTSEPKTWYNNALVNFPVGSPVKVATSVGSKLAKAKSVGANTVKFPVPDKVAFNPAELINASKVLWFGLSSIIDITVWEKLNVEKSTNKVA